MLIDFLTHENIGSISLVVTRKASLINNYNTFTFLINNIDIFALPEYCSCGCQQGCGPTVKYVYRRLRHIKWLFFSECTIITPACSLPVITNPSLSFIEILVMG